MITSDVFWWVTYHILPYKKKKKLKEEGKEGGKEGGEEIPISHFVKEKYQNKWDKILGLIMDLIFRAYLLSIALFQMTYF